MLQHSWQPTHNDGPSSAHTFHLEQGARQLNLKLRTLIKIII